MTDQHTPDRWGHHEPTPGPWRLRYGAAFIRVVAGPDATTVADGIPNEANARLIEAAPEMLEALEALMLTIDAQINAGLRWDPEEVAAARSVITKVRGTQ